MKMQDNLYSIFDSTTENHWWFVGRRKIVLGLVGKIIAGRARSRIVDIGCGAGATLKRLEERGEATGVDLSAQAIRYSRQRGCRRLCLVEEEQLPFGDNTIDLVVSSDVIEHMDHDYLHLREYRRILRGGGLLLITVPALSWLWSNHDRANRHRRRYSRSGLRELLEKEGWKIERLSYFCTFLFPLIMPIKLISRAVTRTIADYNPAWNFKIPGLGINFIFSRIFGWESFWLLRHAFPIGSSLLAICRKP
jgi:SAM-dependent methyltransferase